MILYGALWIGLMAFLLLAMLYVAHRLELLRTGILLVLALATATAWGLRALTYMQFLRILSFYELEHWLLLAATIFGTLLQIGYGFVILSLFSMLWPRTLRVGDLAVLSLLAAAGLSLAGMVYGLAKLFVVRIV